MRDYMFLSYGFREMNVLVDFRSAGNRQWIFLSKNLTNLISDELDQNDYVHDQIRDERNKIDVEPDQLLDDLYQIRSIRDAVCVFDSASRLCTLAIHPQSA